MKIDNKKKVAPILEIIYVVIAFLLIIGFFFSFIAEERFDPRIPNGVLLVIAFLILGYLYWLGHAVFFYDSSGEAITIKNQSFTPLPFLNKDVKLAEFPRRKIKRYRIKKIFPFKKKLKLTLHSNKSMSGKTSITYDISYLTGKEIRDLKISLSNIAKENARNEKRKNTIDKNKDNVNE